MGYNLPNFYKEFSNDSEAFKLLLRSYEEVLSMICDYADQVSDDTIINKIGTYRNIPYQRIDVSDATYDIREIMYENATNLQLKLYGFEADTLSVDEKINIWNNYLTLQQKMQILDVIEKNIKLISLKDIFDSEKDMTPNIVDFELYDDKGNKMIKRLDYDFKNNALYLFKKLATKDEYGKRIIVLRNIYLDYNTPESKLGMSLKIPYDKNFTKNEYRDIMEALLYGALGGPTVRNFNESFKTMLYKAGFTVHDYKTRDKIKRTFWYPEHGGIRLGPFDFIISMPAESYYDSVRYGLIRKYLDIIKPAFANYIVSPEIEYKDILDMRSKKRERVLSSQGVGFYDELLLYNNIHKLKKISMLSIDSEPIYSMPNYILDNPLLRYDDVLKTDQPPAFYEIIRDLDYKIRLNITRALIDKYIVKSDYAKNTPIRYIADKIFSSFAFSRFGKLTILDSINRFPLYDTNEMKDSGYYDIINIKDIDTNIKLMSVMLKEIVNLLDREITTATINVRDNQGNFDKINRNDNQTMASQLLIKPDLIYGNYIYDSHILLSDSSYTLDEQPSFGQIIKYLDWNKEIFPKLTLVDMCKSKGETGRFDYNITVLNSQGKFDKINRNDNQTMTSQLLIMSDGKIIKYLDWNKEIFPKLTLVDMCKSKGETGRFDYNMTVLNSQGKFDKMNMNDIPKPNQIVNASEKTQNGGSILRYDTQDVLLDDALYLQADLAEPKQDWASMYYLDSIVIKLIPKQ